MSNQDLARFERRLEEWESVHSMRFEHGIDRIVDAHLKNTDRIIVSQKRIESGIDKIAFELKEVAFELRDLGSAFMWYHLDLIWHLELQGETLKRILEVLQAPLDTQAKELRKRAEDAYRNGWIDEALEDFLESEKKNRYDFTVHQSIGNIYLFHKKDPMKALDFYKKAAKYANKPECYYYAGLAYLHIGLVHYLLEDFQGAYEATSKAITLIDSSPMLSEAHYQHARYCALLGKCDEAIEHLKKAIRENRYYCVKADNEKDFDVMKERLRLFFKDLRDKAQSYAKSEIEKAEELIRGAKVEKEKAEELIRGAESYEVRSDKFLSAIKELNEARTFLERGSLFDCWDAISKAQSAQRMALDSPIEFLDSSIKYLSAKIEENERKPREKGEELAFYSSIPISIILAISITIYFLPHLHDFMILKIIQIIVVGISIVVYTIIAYYIIRYVIITVWNAVKVPELAKLKSKLSELKTKRSHFEIKKEGKK